MSSRSALFSRLVAFAPAILALACTPAISSGPEVATTGTPAHELVQQGRKLVITHACGACHGGVDNPAANGWLVGFKSPEQMFQVGPFKTYPRNLTPDNSTGLGRFSERQIFNALRYGLRPGETPDVEITSSVPGQGNFPVTPKYLAIPMPWTEYRHMTDAQLWAIAAYLKRGLKPVSHRVPDSEGPPDFWASDYARLAGTHPAPAFPTANERVP